MQKINFQDLPSTATPLNANNMNAIQSNVEDVFDGDVPMGDVRVNSIKSKNLFNINNLTMGSGSVNYDTGTITVNQFANTSNQTLKQLCPDMVAGETYTLSLTTTSNNNYIYLVGSSSEWNNNTQHTITQAELDDVIYFYGNWQSTATITITDIQIEKGSTKTSFSKYQGIGYVSGLKGSQHYIKYDDGTLECWGTKTLSNVTITNTQGALYRSDWISGITFPVTFTTVNVCNVFIHDCTYMCMIATEGGPSTTSTQACYIVRGNSSTIANITLGYYAMGRWK